MGFDGLMTIPQYTSIYIITVVISGRKTIQLQFFCEEFAEIPRPSAAWDPKLFFRASRKFHAISQHAEASLGSIAACNGW
jgi:hypothetical protein